jgi:hypothetical protein
MGRIAWIAVALVFLTAAPVAQAGWLSFFDDAGKVVAKDAAKAGVKGAEVTSNAVKIETKVGGHEATGASVEATGVKFETTGGGGDDPPVWFWVLFAVGVGGWLLWKSRGKRP